LKTIVIYEDAPKSFISRFVKYLILSLTRWTSTNETRQNFFVFGFRIY